MPQPRAKGMGVIKPVQVQQVKQPSRAAVMDAQLQLAAARQQPVRPTARTPQPVTIQPTVQAREIKPAAYISRKALLGVGQGLSSVEDAGRVLAARKVQGADSATRRAASMVKGSKSGDGGRAALESIYSMIYEPYQQALLGTRWVPDRGVVANLLDVAGAGAQLAMDTVGGPAKRLADEAGALALGINQLQRARKTGKDYRQVSATDQLALTQDNLLGSLLGLDKAREVLDGSAQGKAVQWIGDLAESVGGMAAPLAVSVLTRSPAVGSTILGVQAGGSKAREALDSGASVDEAYQAGLLSGGAEAGIEALMGGIPALGKGVMGSSVRRMTTAASKAIPQGVRQAAAKTASKLPQGVRQAAAKMARTGKQITPVVNRLGGEGLEEVLSTALDPQISRATYDPDAEAAGAKELTSAFGQGVALSALLGGIKPREGGSKVQTDPIRGQRRQQQAQGARETPVQPGTPVSQVQPPVTAQQTIPDGDLPDIPLDDADMISPPPMETADDDLPINAGKDDPMELPGIKEIEQEINDQQAPVIRGTFGHEAAKGITGKGVGRSKDVYGNVRAAAGDSPRAKAELERQVIQPLQKAKRQYAQDAKAMLAQIKALKRKYKLKPKSRDSAAVQMYGEGYYIDAAGDRQPYTEQMLRDEFGETRALELMACDAEIRQIYDSYIDRLNAMLEKLYPDPLGVAQAQLQRLREAAASYRVSAEADDAQARVLYQDLTNKAARLQREIESGDVLVGKRITRRRDYYHHFTELDTGWGALRNILGGDLNIDPLLVGKSEGTKPKSRFAGFGQRRTGERYQRADAIDGLRKYALLAEYKLAFDPYVAHLRGVARSIAEGTRKTRNANDFIQWLTDYANDLAGKTNPLDRWLVQSTGGRKAIGVIKWINQRARLNATAFSARTAISQFFNLPNAALVVDLQDWPAGIRDFAQSLGRNAETAPDKESPFLAERYIGRDIAALDEGIAASAQKFGSWLATFGDEATTKMIWYMARNKGMRDGLSGDALIDYADELTLKAVGGRGTGETALTQKSELVKLVAPFQVEVNNQWNLLKDAFKHKEFGKLAAHMMLTTALNTLTREAFGIEVTPDVLHAIWDAITDWDGQDEDEQNMLDLLLGIGKRVGGEVASMHPFGAPALSYLLPETAREQLFGESDPTRYGTGNMGLNTVIQPVQQMLTGQDFSDELLSSFLSIVPPGGGRQIERTITGVKNATGFDPVLQVSKGEDGKYQANIFGRQDRVPGGSYTASGNLRFPVDNTAGQIAIGALFGPYATSQGKDYISNKDRPLSDTETAFFNALARAGGDGNEAYALISELSRKDLSKQDKLQLVSDSADPEEAARYMLRKSGQDTLDKADELREQYAIPYLDYYAYRSRYGDADQEGTLNGLYQMQGLSTRQKAALYASKGYEGNYAQWEQARRELIQSPVYQRLSAEQQNKVKNNCLRHGTGERDWSEGDAAVLAGWSLGEFYTMEAAIGGMTADKDAGGKTISGSKKAKVMDYLDRSGLSMGQQGVYLLLTQNYKLSDEMIRAAGQYLLQSAETDTELQELAELCGFALNPNGTLRYTGKRE